MLCLPHFDTGHTLLFLPKANHSTPYCLFLELFSYSFPLSLSYDIKIPVLVNSFISAYKHAAILATKTSLTPHFSLLPYFFIPLYSKALWKEYIFTVSTISPPVFFEPTPNSFCLHHFTYSLLLRSISSTLPNPIIKSQASSSSLSSICIANHSLFPETLHLTSRIPGGLYWNPYSDHLSNSSIWMSN